ALLVAEQLGLEHLAGQRAAVDRHERPLRARGALMDAACHELLAGPALAEHEHRRVRGGDAVHDAQHLVHARALGEDAAEGRGAGRVGPQGLVVAEKLALLGGLAHDDVELLDLRRLREVIVGAELHRLHRGGHLLEACHHDHLGMLGERAELAQDLDPLLARHLHVEDDDVVRALAQPRQRRLPVAHALDLVALASQLAHEQLAQPALVIGDQHAERAAHSCPPCGYGVSCGCAGTTMRNTLPLPGRLWTSIRPPWSATMPCAMARPRPVPCPGGLVVKNGSKIRPRISSGTPGPSSSNSTSTSSRMARVRTVRRPRPSIASSPFEATPRNTWRNWPSLMRAGGSSGRGSVTR